MAVRNGSRGSAVGGSDLCGPPRPPCPPAWSCPAPVAGGWCSARRRGVPARSRRRSTSRSPDSRDRRCPRRGGLTPAAGRSTVGSMDGRSHPGTAALHEGLPPRMRDAVDAFAAHLSGERNRSVHTVRAYITDVVSLLDHAPRGRRVVRVFGKGAKERSVPYGLPAEQALDRWLRHGRPALENARSGRALLLGARGGRVQATTVRRVVDRAARQAGLAHLSPHGL